MKCGSLFSGIAGIDLGFQRAGIETAWFCEYDKAARSVLERHFPGVPIYEDVTTLDPGSVEPVDILTGGFPCQDVSVAGRRAGLAGERSGLFHEFMRIADSLAPQWVLVENVPGLLSSNDGRDMGVVLSTLGELGYGWAYRILDAQYFGVAQRRRRVFIVGCLGDPRSAAEVLFELESCDGNPAPRREARAVPAGATEEGSGTPRIMRWREGKPGGGKGALVSEDRSLTLATSNDQYLFESVSTLQGGGVAAIVSTSKGRREVISSLKAKNGGPDDNDAQAGHLIVEREREVWTVTNDSTPVVSEDRASTLKVGTGLDIQSAQVVVSFDHKQTGDPSASMPVYENHTGTITANKEQAVALSENQRGEVLETEYSRQITTGGGKPGQGYPAARIGMVVRRLTPLECERLQGFPDGWTDEQKDSARYRQLGNAVCVPVAQWIGERIMRTSQLRNEGPQGTRGEE